MLADKRKHVLLREPQEKVVKEIQSNHFSPAVLRVTLRVKAPNNRVLGSKYYNINGIWALKSHSLGPWTLRIRNPKP